MNLALGLNPLYANLHFVNYCLRTLDIRFKAFFLAKMELKNDGKSYHPLDAFNFMLSRLGLNFTSYLVFSSVMPKVFKLIPEKFSDGKLWSLEKLAKEFGIKIYYHDNFNSLAFQNDLKKMDIDILILNGTNQILKEKTIEKVTCLNLHPSYLPEYRGMFPVFQMMLNNEDYVGATLVEITTKIDKGPILARAKLPVDKNLSYFLREKKSLKLTGDVLKGYLDDINSFSPQTQSEKALNPYRSYPFKKEVNLFKASGHKFINWSEIISACEFEKKGPLGEALRY